MSNEKIEMKVTIVRLLMFFIVTSFSYEALSYETPVHQAITEEAVRESLLGRK